MLGRDGWLVLFTPTDRPDCEGTEQMSNDPLEQQRRNVSEFLQMLPLTLAIAGLPDAEHGRHFNEGQMETRATTIRNAYKVARQLLKEVQGTQRS
jgi:hypothetical protein